MVETLVVVWQSAKGSRRQREIYPRCRHSLVWHSCHRTGVWPKLVCGKL